MTFNVEFLIQLTMADKEELEKLFEAALHGRKAPSRFGTPEDQVKAAPAAFQKADDAPVSPFKADTSEAKPFVAFTASPTQAEPSQDDATSEVVLDEKALSSLDENANAEFEAITDKKIAKAKAKRRRERVVFFLLLIGSVVGAGGWLVTNPDKMEAVKKILVQLRTSVDPTAVAAGYDESLEKIGEHGNTLDDATAMLGGKKGEGDDESMDKELQQLAGEEMGGLSAEEKKKKLDALGKKVPIKKKDEKADDMKK